MPTESADVMIEPKDQAVLGYEPAMNPGTGAGCRRV